MSQMFILLVPRITECLVFGDPTLKEEPQDVAEDTLTLVLSPMRQATCSRDQITPVYGATGTGISSQNLDAQNWLRRTTSDCLRYPTSPQAKDGLGRGRLANL